MKILFIGIVVCITGVLSQGDSNCSSLTSKADCCLQADCAFSNCNNATKFVCQLKKNLNLTACKNEQATNQCALPVAGDCSSLYNKTECCAVGSCAFIKCDNATVSQCSNASSISKANCTAGGAPVDQCTAVVTLLPTGETAASSTAQPTVVTASSSEITSTAPGITNTTASASTAAPTPVTNASASTAAPTPVTKVSTPESPTGTSGTTTDQTVPPCSSGQHFDAASFIGGIVLCGGIVVIIFFACKFYKSRSERTYHQF